MCIIIVTTITIIINIIASQLQWLGRPSLVEGEKKIGPNLRLTSARCIGRGAQEDGIREEESRRRWWGAGGCGEQAVPARLWPVGAPPGPPCGFVARAYSL
jgi:hypothetical protein